MNLYLYKGYDWTGETQYKEALALRNKTYQKMSNFTIPEGMLGG
jgi:hypothetical protein